MAINDWESGTSKPHLSNLISSVPKPSDCTGFIKGKRDKSESGCESVGDNFEMQYKPITNSKMRSSDCASDKPTPIWTDDNMEIMVKSYYKIIQEGKDISPIDALRRLKKSFTGRFTHKLLINRLSYIHTLFGRRDDEFCKKFFHDFKNKYEKCNFWETYLQMVQHPNFHTFDTGTSSCRSGTSSGRSKSSIGLSAGPSSVSLDSEPDQYSSEIVINILENLDLDDKELFYQAAFAFQSKELRKIFVLLKDDNRRREFLYFNFRK